MILGLLDELAGLAVLKDEVVRRWGVLDLPASLKTARLALWTHLRNPRPQGRSGLLDNVRHAYFTTGRPSVVQSIAELAELFEVSRPTVYRTLERQRAQSTTSSDRTILPPD